jgi:hypothetical protein
MVSPQRRLRLFFLFAILSLALASLTACTQTPQIPMDQTFSSSDARFSLRYPKGWSVIQSSDTSATLVNTENWQKTTTDDKNCYLVVGIADWTKEEVAQQKAADPTFAAAIAGEMPTPIELVDLIVKGNAPDNVVTENRMRINGNMAATLDEPMSLSGGQQMQVVAVDLENGSYVLAAGATVKESMPTCADTTMAVVKTVKWNPGK